MGPSRPVNLNPRSLPMTDVLAGLTPYIVRVLARYMVGALAAVGVLTAAQG
jgi:hypothetical protein